MMRLSGKGCFPAFTGFLGLVIGVGLLAAPVSAQGRRGGDRDRELRPDKLDDAEKKKLNELQLGRDSVDGQDKLLKKAAEYLVFRLTIKKNQLKKPDEVGTSDTMRSLVEEAFKHIPVQDPDPRKRQPLKEEQQKYVRAFSKHLAAALKEVFDGAAPIAQVNGGLILARLGDTGVEEVADPMCEVLENKDSDDTAKLYALIGLKNLYKCRWYKDPAGEVAFTRFKDEEREVRTVKDLVDFLNRKPSNPNVTPEAFQFIRREAIRALAETHLSAVGKDRSPTARPALDLLKLMRNDGVALEPSITEQVEAAIALCEIQANLKDVKYQPDYAAFFIGKTVVDFATRYNAERGQSARVEWKYYAHRLMQALDDLKKDSGGKFPAVANVVARATPVLANIVANNPTDQVAFNDWLDKNPPKSTELFRGMGDAVIKAAEPARAK